MVNELNLLDRMRASLRVHQFNVNTEKAYMYWARAFVEYHNKQDPSELGRADVESFISYLASARYAAVQTQNQALHAVLFLYRDVLGNCPDWLNELIAEQGTVRKSNILSKDEIQSLLSNLYGQEWLAVSLIYGAGLRVNECISLRVRDIDLQKQNILVRQANGAAGWMTIMPKKLIPSLRTHIEDRKLLHIKDVADGLGEVYLPVTIREQYPNGARSWSWQYAFPSAERAFDVTSGNMTRPSHISEDRINKAIERAAIEAQIYTRVTPTTLRNSFAVHMIRNGVDSKQVEALLGHGTEEELDGLQAGIKSPLDELRIH
ncbi:MAG: integron integrase [Xanthomonadales bacterium]|nr:integron integrase [Xanthomonadales bacterium]